MTWRFTLEGEKSKKQKNKFCVVKVIQFINASVVKILASSLSAIYLRQIN